MASELSQLKPIKIHFPSEDVEEKGFYALVISGMPVKCLPDGRYIVNHVQCGLLTSKGIEYIKG